MHRCMKNWVLIVCFFVSSSSSSLRRLDDLDFGREMMWWSTWAHMGVLGTKIAASWMLYQSTADIQERLLKRDKKQTDLDLLLERNVRVLQGAIGVSGVELLNSIGLAVSNHYQEDRVTAMLGIFSATPWFVHMVMEGVSIQSVRDICDQLPCWTSRRGEPTYCEHDRCPDESTYNGWIRALSVMIALSAIASTVQAFAFGYLK